MIMILSPCKSYRNSRKARQIIMAHTDLIIALLKVEYFKLNMLKKL